MGVKFIDFKVDDWDLPIPSPAPGESSMTAKIEGAEITANYTDEETRTIRFKKGSVIKTTLNSGGRGAVSSWNPDDELLDTTTR